MTGFRFCTARVRLFSAVVCAQAAFSVVPLSAADWPHYRGPAQNGVTSEELGAVPKAGPRQIWKASLGTGTSGIIVGGNRVFSMGNVSDRDIVYCLDAKTGRELWKHTYPLKLDKRMFEGGPASTPTLDGNLVYTVSHHGDLFCLDAATGRKVWHKHYQQDFAGERPQWGFAGSPLVEGKLVVCDVGGKGASTVAFDKATGAVVWKSGNDRAGYASPIAATISGQRTIVVFKAAHLVGLDPKDGRELWRAPWKTSYDVNAATPLVVGDHILVTSGYGTGCALLKVSSGKATEVWRNKSLRAQINSPVAWKDHIYGVDDQTGSGKLVCLSVADGKLRWSEKSVQGGALICASGKLIVLSERGELVMADANPDSFKALARLQVLGGRCWVQPTFADGRIYVRNNQGELVCLSY